MRQRIFLFYLYNIVVPVFAQKMEPSVSAKCISCERCSQEIKTREFLKCCSCVKYYDLLCTNVSEKRFYNTMREEHKSNWKCEKCIGIEKTSDGSGGDPAFLNVTIRNHPGKSNASASPGVLFDAESSDLVVEMRLLREEVRASRAEMQEFRCAISSLTSAVSACSRRIDDLTTRVETLENRQREPLTPGGTSALEQTIAELKLELNDRDQELLCNDIEIAGIPEEKNENSTHIIMTVATKLGVTLDERDVVSAERAGAARRAESDGQAARPRPLVVRLARRVQRDELLNAARVRRNVTTAGLGLASTECRFYVNERLTRVNRSLFYKARTESQRANWKYVWTRDGKIFTRKEHGASRHRLRSETDMTKIFGLI